MDSDPTPPQGFPRYPEEAAYWPTVSGPAVPPYPGDVRPPPAWPHAPTPAPAAAGGPRPRRRRGWIIGIAVTAVVGLAGGAAAAVLLIKKPESPTTMALQSGQALAPAAGLTLTGTIDGSAATVTVTRAGTVTGSYTQDQDQITRVTLGGVTYYKAPAAFWTAGAGADRARLAGGRWARVPSGKVLMSFASFTPGQIAGVLEHVGQHPRVTDTTFGGSKVIKLSEHGTDYYITSDRPNRLLRMTGTSGATSWSFDLTPLNAAAIGPVFTILHGDVQDMRGAAEPGALILPEEKIQFDPDCKGSTSCTVRIKVSVSDPASQRDLLTLHVAFSGTQNGRPFATCTDTIPVNTATSSGTVTPACGPANSVWSHWFNSHTSDFSTWADPTFNVTVNAAGDIAAMQQELNKEQGT